MRSRSHAHLGALGITCLMALCACGSRPQTTLPAELTSQIEKVVNAGDVNGCAAVFTDDAEILQEDAAVVRGKQAIHEFCASQIHPELALDVTSTMSIASGDLAFEQGTYHFRNVKIGANVEYGEYLNVWRKQGTQWKIFRSMYDKTETLPTEVSVSESESDTDSQ